MPSKIQLTGGAFQDISGNPLNKGYLLMTLSQDAQVQGTPSQQIASGRVIKIALDSSGNVSTSPAQYVWPNDVLTPSNTFYTVEAYTAQGELVWGPNSEQVFSTPSPYDIGAWHPNVTQISNASVITYDIGVFFPGSPAASQLLLLMPFERQVRFATNFSPSVGAVSTNPTALTTFVINKNGSQVATMLVATNGSVSFVSNTGATFNVGDVLSIVAPASPDATIANIGVTLSGVVVGAA